ncbi:hypothetical protein ABEB36_009746 [Hypothenemus hampei]|uniref:MARVEL domain-containing protein n=1 Tax=Hypothenemus hampei TaxID=57062 RepID=A0ABD1EHD6_HYPHA
MSSEVKIEEKKDVPKKEEETVVVDDEDKQIPELPTTEEQFTVKFRQQWQLIIKILELITSALCFGLFYQPANQSANLAKHHLEQVAVILLAYVGYILINLVFIVARCLNDKIPFRVGALFSLVAALLNVTSGILLIVNRTNKFQGMYYEPHKYLESMLSAATVLSFINAVFFSVDAVYTFILKQNF